MCAFSQDHTLLKQLFQQNFIDDCRKKGTNKKQKCALKNKKKLSSPVAKAHAGLHMRDIFARKFCRVCPGKGYQRTTLVADD